ncbi:MAG: hypothetical protein AB7J13_11700 [Pyrinomonadaceae bacterium]
MKAPILGIITIFFLQLGFVAYQKAEQVLDLTYQPVAPIRTGSIGAADVDITYGRAGVGDEDQTMPGKMPLVRSQTSRYGHAAAVRRRASRPRPFFEPAREASPDDFRAVVITYRKPKKEQSAAPQATVAISDGPSSDKKKKKSFLAKTGGVIKKPYDWIKSIGSVFD